MYYQEKGLEINRNLFGARSDEIANSYFDLAKIYNRMSEFQKGIEYLEKVLEMKIFLFGEMNQRISNILDELGLISRNQGNYDKSIYSKRVRF